MSTVATIVVRILKSMLPARLSQSIPLAPIVAAPVLRPCFLFLPLAAVASVLAQAQAPVDVVGAAVATAAVATKYDLVDSG